MNMKPSIHRATLADLDALAVLFDGYRRFYGQATDVPRARAFLAERLERDEAVVFLAERDGAAVGFTLLYPGFTSVGTARVFVLNDLYVAEQVRRCGVGVALLEAAAAYARAAGAPRISLETAQDNHAAQALYRRAGWTADATQWFHLPLAPVESP
jgi:ribosomal protein S18 acetylase RimI-like enzyme